MNSNWWERQLIMDVIRGCQDISSYAISTAAISTVHTFNRSHLQPRAISTPCNFNRREFNRFNYIVINKLQ